MTGFRPAQDISAASAAGLPFFTVKTDGTGNYSDIQSALDAVPSAGATIEVSGTHTVTSSLLIKQSNTELILTGGAVVQCNGSSVSTLIKPNTTGLSRIKIRGGKWLQTTASAVGTAFDFSDCSDSVFEPTRIEEFDTAIKINDTTNVTFYNRYKNTQIFNCNNGILIGTASSSTQPNQNYFTGMRIRPKAGGAGYALRIQDARGNTFINCDFEPGTGTGITGVSLEQNATSLGYARETTFINCWFENNATNVNIDAGVSRTTFIGCSITSALTTDIVDNGTATVFINTSKTGATYQKHNWIRYQYTAVTANTTLNTNHGFVDCTSGTFTITLPDSAGLSGREYIVKNSGTGVISFATTSSQTIDGLAATFFTLYPGDVVHLISDDANWKAETTNAQFNFKRATKMFRAYHDCIAATSNVDMVFGTNGTGAAWAQVANWATGTVGVTQADLGTTTTGRVTLGSTNTNIVSVNAGTILWSARIQLPNLSDATNTYTLRGGLMSSFSAEPSNGIYFRYTHGTNSGKFEAVTRAAGTETATDTGITAAASTTYDLDIVVNAAGTSVSFMINGTVVATNSTNIPSGAMGYNLGVIRSAGTSNFLALDVDFEEIFYEFTTAR